MLPSHQGNGVLEIRGAARVDDGDWHEVRAQFSPSYLEVTVDGMARWEITTLKSAKYCWHACFANF